MSYNGITSAFQADDAGSIPATRSKEFTAHIAQTVERHLGKVEVTGSIPVMSSSIVVIFGFAWSTLVIAGMNAMSAFE